MASKALVPRLRFPEFRDEPGWAQCRIGDLLRESRIPSSTRDPRRRITVRLNLQGVEKREFRGTEAADATVHYVRRAGQFIYGKQNIHKGAFGIVPPCLDGFESSQDLPSFSFTTQCDQNWFLQMFSREEFYRPLELRMRGTGSKRLNERTFEAIIVAVPGLAEQRKIAECLTSLDELIAAEGRKLEALRKFKKGLMQNLFPREGETTPRLRFPEFRNAGEWVEKPLEDVCEILNSRRVPVTSSDRKPGPYPYYGASGVVDYIDDFIFDERLVLVGEDGAKWEAFEPTAFLAEGKYWVNNHAHVLRSVHVIDTLLANYLTMIDVGQYVTGAAPPKLTLGKLRTIPIPVSPHKEEQEQIASCLGSLDALIANRAKRLDTLKTHRQGLMQGLFPPALTCSGDISNG